MVNRKTHKPSKWGHYARAGAKLFATGKKILTTATHTSRKQFKGKHKQAKRLYAPTAYGNKGNAGGTSRKFKFGRALKPLSKTMVKRINDALGNKITLDQRYVNQQQAASGTINMLPLVEFPRVSELVTIQGQIPALAVGTPPASTTGPQIYSHGKFTLEDQIQTTYITSAELANINLECYLFRARKDIPYSEGTISTLFQNGFVANGQSALSHVNYGNALAGNNDANSAETPFDSFNLCHYFKCIRKVKKILAPGETLRLEVDQLKSQLISGYTIITENPVALKGCLMWVSLIGGTPADDAGTKLIVGTTGAKVNIIQTMTATAHAVNCPAALALGNTGSISLAITAPTIVNPDTDVSLAEVSV